ncbi:unnamed protein product, partial [Strongylus vulgaris]
FVNKIRSGRWGVKPFEFKSVLERVQCICTKLGYLTYLGEPGKPGHAGLVGVPGYTGHPGRAGDRGVRGPPGDNAIAGEGMKGPQGLAGPQGAKGPPGTPGEDLLSGGLLILESNYLLPLQYGAYGERGSAGPPGEPGMPSTYCPSDCGVNTIIAGTESVAQFEVSDNSNFCYSACPG